MKICLNCKKEWRHIVSNENKIEWCNNCGTLYINGESYTPQYVLLYNNLGDEKE